MKTSTHSTCTKDPENEEKFEVAYKKVMIHQLIIIQLAIKLQKEEGANVLVPDGDLRKFETQPKLDV